uniref:Uncharacterized protein n=1 Tax=Aegilops tauschii subsp. strangulata TaxID=200361 RepID=A0A453JE84_AEGTS
MADPYGDGRALRNHPPPAQQQRPRLKPALEMEDLISLLHGSDPVRVELTRLENDLHYKEKELGDAQAEIKALRLSERAREKAVEDNWQRWMGSSSSQSLSWKARTLKPRRSTTRRKQRLLPSLQPRLRCGGFMQRRRTMTCLPSRPSLRRWRPS